MTNGKAYRAATARVYWGAAFLVLAMGMRAILETIGATDQLKDIVTYIAVLSLVLEFGLLIAYGRIIRGSDDDTPDESAEKGNALSDRVVAAMEQASIALAASNQTMMELTKEVRKERALRELVHMVDMVEARDRARSQSEITRRN